MIEFPDLAMFINTNRRYMSIFSSFIYNSPYQNFQKYPILHHSLISILHKSLLLITRLDVFQCATIVPQPPINRYPISRESLDHGDNSRARIAHVIYQIKSSCVAAVQTFGKAHGPLMLLTYLTLLSSLLSPALSRPLAPTEPVKEASTSDNEIETAAPTNGLAGLFHLPASTTPTAAWLPMPDAILLTKDPAPVPETEHDPDQSVTKFKDYDEYITGPTPSFPMVIEEALAGDHSGERLDSIITSDWSKCETREQVARRLSPEVELELQRRLERLGDRYSRLRSHKPLVKHQLQLGTSFLRTALGNVLQDPTDALFSTGKLDTVRSIPVRFIKALNHVAGETSSVLGYLMAFGYLPKAIKDSARNKMANIRIGNADSFNLDSSDVTPCQVEEAIAEFQSFNGLPVTRQLDVETAHKLRQQRLGTIL